MLKLLWARLRSAGLVLVGYRPAEVRYDHRDDRIADTVATEEADRLAAEICWFLRRRPTSRDESETLHSYIFARLYRAITRYAEFDAAERQRAREAREYSRYKEQTERQDPEREQVSDWVLQIWSSPHAPGPPREDSDRPPNAGA